MMRLRNKPACTPLHVPRAPCDSRALRLDTPDCRYIPYPLYILVSSCKLIPVMIVGMIVNRTWRSNRDYACAAIMTVGIIMYSWQQISGSGAASTAKAGHHGAAGGGAGSHSLFGIELDATKSLIAGVGFTLLNLSMEGYTNASQDRLFSKGRKEGRPRIPALFMMASMNAWTVVILSVALAFEVFVRGAESFLWSAGSFAHRHPELVLHICSFSVLGAIAQIFIFTSIEHHGSFTTTTVTISRKFVSVLISVAVFGHALSVIQWIGVLNVFAGLGIQLSSGSSGHAHAHAQPKSPGASIKAEATAAHVPAASIGKASAAAAAADRAGVRRRRRAVGPIDVSSSQGGYGYDSLRVESTPSSPMAVRLKEGHSSESEDEDGGVEGNEGGAGGGAVDIESPSEKRGARMSAGAGAGGVGFAISGSPSEQRSSGGGGAGVTRSGSKSKQR